MKRLTAILMLFLFLAVLFGCAQEEEFIAPVSFHYLRAPLPNGEVMHGSADSVIVQEIREGDGYQDDYTDLLEIYLLGPLDRQFLSPFPLGTYLVDFALENGTASVTLTDDFATLSGIDLSLACGCLTMTVLDLTGAENVTIRSEGALLDGKETITMNRSILVLFDNATPDTN